VVDAAPSEFIRRGRRSGWNLGPARLVLGDHQEGEDGMDWDRVKGRWKEMSGQAKQQWGKLTDDDVARVDGKREELEGVLQQRYGKSKDEIRKEVDDWLNRI
jgi:uncharacterized protein YjbJ (UPF0337 family)